MIKIDDTRNTGSPPPLSEEDVIDRAIRPKTLSKNVVQDTAKS